MRRTRGFLEGSKVGCAEAPKAQRLCRKRTKNQKSLVSASRWSHLLGQVGVGGVFGEDYLRIDASHTLEAGRSERSPVGKDIGRESTDLERKNRYSSVSTRLCKCKMYRLIGPDSNTNIVDTGPHRFCYFSRRLAVILDILSHHKF